MKLITKLSAEQVLTLIDEGSISNVFIITVTEEIKSSIKEFLSINTGFEDLPIMGISKIEGATNLEEGWDTLTSLIDVKTNDFLLEFDMPNDMLATISYNRFLELLYNNPNRIADNLTFESHSNGDDDDNEFAFASMVLFKYCTGYKLIGENWESEDCELNDPKELLKESKVFQK